MDSETLKKQTSLSSGATPPISSEDATRSGVARPDSEGEEQELVARAIAGDLGAFDRIVTNHRSSSFAMVHAILRNEQDAWDVSQEGFVRAWRALGRFRGESSFKTWLHRIMTNAALDFLRRSRNRRGALLNEALAPDDPLIETELAKAGGSSPAESLRLAEIRERINDALDRLSPDHRAVILLKEVEGLQYNEIAERLSISIGTVMSRLFYARKKLQKLLSDLYENES